MQVTGGLVLATMGWALLNKQDAESKTGHHPAASRETLMDKIFYPLTFPITAGPGCIVVSLTLSAHASELSLLQSALAHLGLLIGTILIGIVVYFSYAYADKDDSKAIARNYRGDSSRDLLFILLCIGGEIMWSGIQNLIKTIS